MIAKLELITRTIKISLNNPPSLQGGSNQSLQSAYVRAINNVENRANQPNVSFNKISPRLPSTSSRSPNLSLSLSLLPPFSRYSINVIGPNPRWSTRSAVNRGVFCPRNWISCLSLKRGGNHIPDTISSQNDAICALRWASCITVYVWNEVIKILRGPLIFLRIMVSIIPRRVVGSWSPRIPLARLFRAPLSPPSPLLTSVGHKPIWR